ncbi:MAG: MarC family protein [Alphaproteobacteria bacterium]
MDLELLISTFVTLFVIVDPIGLVPIFLAVTHGMSRRERRRAAIEAALVAFGVLAGALLIGEWLLRNLGIGLPAFRIAGGLLLFVIGFEMLFDRRQRRKADDASDVVQERQSGLAVFPLAIPMMSGPGAITAAVLLSSNADGDAVSLLSLLGVFALVIGITFVVFLLAPWLERVVGHKSQSVLVRLLGILVAALAVQFIVDGIAEAFALGG